jgi:sec-independent protein translocase protein TatB
MGRSRACDACSAWLRRGGDRLPGVFNVGGGEIIVILLLALIVLGPERLPDAAKKVGRFMGEVRRMTTGFQEEVRSAMDLDGSGDALERAEPGPRLMPPPTNEAPATPATNGEAGPPETQPGRGDSSAA